MRPVIRRQKLLVGRKRLRLHLQSIERDGAQEVIARNFFPHGPDAVQRGQAFCVVLIHDQRRRQFVPRRHRIGLQFRGREELLRRRNQLVLIAKTPPVRHSQVRIVRVGGRCQLQLLQHLRVFFRELVGIRQRQPVGRGRGRADRRFQIRNRSGSVFVVDQQLPQALPHRGMLRKLFVDRDGLGLHAGLFIGRRHFEQSVFRTARAKVFGGFRQFVVPQQCPCQTHLGRRRFRIGFQQSRVSRRRTRRVAGIEQSLCVVEVGARLFRTSLGRFFENRQRFGGEMVAHQQDAEIEIRLVKPGL